MYYMDSEGVYIKKKNTFLQICVKITTYSYILESD